MLRLSASPWRKSLLAVALVLLAGGAVSAALIERRNDQRELTRHAEAITGGNVARGEALFQARGCGGCHQLGGIPGARGRVGPPLDGVGTRAIIAGRLDNTPANLASWIEQPQAISPGTAMPNLGIGPQQARDLAALLYSRS